MYIIILYRRERETKTSKTKQHNCKQKRFYIYRYNIDTFTHEKTRNMSGDLKITNRGLSKTWTVDKKHVCAYTGGKVELTKNEEFIVALNSGDVSFLNVSSGQIFTSVQDHIDGSLKERFTCFSVHPNGSEVVTASANMLLRHWVIKKNIINNHDNNNNNNNMDSTSDAESATSGSSSTSITWECKRTWRSTHSLPIMSMAYDSSGTLVATGSNDQSCRVWDVPRGYCTHSFKGQGGNITVVRFHPDSSRLQLFVGTDGSISQQCQLRAFDLGTRKTLATFSDHMSAITSIAFSENGGWVLCSGGRDKVINFYDTRRWKLYKTVPVYESVEAVATVPLGMLDIKESTISNDSMVVAIGGSKGNVRTWLFTEPRNSNENVNKKKHKKYKSMATCIEFGSSADLFVNQQSDGDNVSDASKQYGITSLLCRKYKKQIISVTDEHFFLFWNASNMPKDKMKKCKQIVGYNDEIIDLVFLPSPSSINGNPPRQQESSKIAMTANSDQLRVFDLNTFDCELLYGHTDIVLACDVSPDGMWLASVSKDQTLRLWDISDENHMHCVGVGVGHAEAVGAVTFGKRPSTYDVRSSYTTAYLFSGSKDKTLKSWSIGSFIREHNNNKKKRRNNSSNDEIEAIIQQQIDAKDSKRAHEKDINSLAMSPNDALLASGSQDKTIMLWNAKDLSSVATLRGHKRGIWSVEFSPVDKYCASASGDRTVKLWNITDFTCMKTFEGHMASVLRIRFLSNGMQMMSSGADGLVKLWTIKTGECDNSFDGHDDKVWALGIRSWVVGENESESGAIMMHSQMVSGGGDSVLNVWQDTTIHEAEKEIKLKEERVEKEQELNNYVAKKQYRKAIILTLELNFPYKLRVLLEELLLGEAPKAKITLRGKSILENKKITDRKKGEQMISEIVKTFSEKRLLQWMKYIRQWNTNSRHSILAQYCLSMVLRNFKPEKLMAISPEMKSITEAILAYSDRHFKRIDKLVQQSYLLDHTLSAMNILNGAIGNNKQNVMTIDSASSSSSSSSSSNSSDSSSDEDDPSSDDEKIEDVSIITKKRLVTIENGGRRSKRIKHGAYI